MSSIYLLLGGNQGERVSVLAKARQLLAEQLGTIIAYSPLYETAAWGKTDQPDFLNQAIHIDTKFGPVESLAIIHDIEQLLGRQRTEHWGQRTLDIDILFYDNAIIHSSRLVIPHPEVQNRRFALIPLKAIAAELVHPVLGKDISTLLDECPDKLEVFLFEDF
ncbi:MAG: 2-amino-4-hydroxy-6-hydroxymethyldihydropteridine diphosphokinase [Bacteroidota bacterium]